MAGLAPNDQPEPQADQPAVLTMVEVQNFNDFPIDDFYDGAPIRLEPNGKNVITLKPEQAAHCFGFPGEFHDMARHMAKRYGWNSREFLRMNEERKTVYEQYAEKVKFTPIYFDLVARPRNAPIPALPEGDQDDDPPQTAGLDFEEDTGTRVGRRIGARPPREHREPSTADVRLDPAR